VTIRGVSLNSPPYPVLGACHWNRYLRKGEKSIVLSMEGKEEKSTKSSGHATRSSAARDTQVLAFDTGIFFIFYFRR
jgi:hypothetical protein